MIEKLKNKIKNLIKVGVKTETIDTKFVEVEFLGKKQQMLLINNYGLNSNPKNDSIAILMNQEGDEESILAIPFDPENYDELDEDEVSIGIPTQKGRIRFKNDGTIVFKIEDTEGGDFMARFDELKKGFDEFKDDFNDFVNTTYNVHTHIVPQSPSGTQVSQTPAQTGTQTAATIDDAKIEEIEVPDL